MPSAKAWRHPRAARAQPAMVRSGTPHANCTWASRLLLYRGRSKPVGPPLPKANLALRIRNPTPQPAPHAPPLHTPQAPNTNHGHAGPALSNSAPLRPLAVPSRRVRQRSSSPRGSAATPMKLLPPGWDSEPEPSSNPGDPPPPHPGKTSHSPGGPCPLACARGFFVTSTYLHKKLIVKKITTIPIDVAPPTGWGQFGLS